MSTWHDCVGNIHMHTVHSDGTGTFADLREAARAAGLHFIIVTDHNVLVREEEGYQDGLLVLVDAEINDEELEPPGNHLLCLGIRDNPVGYAADPQALIDEVRRQGGMAVIAHPVERASALIPDSYPWRSWQVNGYHGLEIWNFMSEFRPHVTGRAKGLLLAFLPALFTTGPYPDLLARWDRLAQERPVVAVGGSDAHAFDVRLGPWKRVVFPYRYCFRAVNTHVLMTAPLTGEVSRDRQAIYDALRAGRCWVGYDLIGNTAGFRFSAAAGGQAAVMGETLPAGPSWEFRGRLPAAADLRLLRDGQVVHRVRGRELAYTSSEPGVYRVEAWRRAWFKPRGWIFSNPIYVRA